MSAATPTGSPDGRAQALCELKAALLASDAIERVGFEVYDRTRPIAGSCLRQATRFIHWAGHDGAVRLDEAQRQRVVDHLKETGPAGWAALTDADMDHCLRSAPVREIMRRRNGQGAAA